MDAVILNTASHTKLVAGLCRDIAVASWRPEIIVGIDDGIIAAVMVGKYLNVPYIHAVGDGYLNYLGEDAMGYERRPSNILVISDTQSPARISALIDNWQQSCLPSDERWNTVWNHNVRFAAVVDRTYLRECPVKMDYSGMETFEGRVIFPYNDWWTK